MVHDCNAWDALHPHNAAVCPTWDQFRKHFVKAFLRHQKNQSDFSQISLANSITFNTASLKANLQNEFHDEFQSDCNDLTTLVANLSSHQNPSTAPSNTMDTLSELSVWGPPPPTNVASELAALRNQVARLITQNGTQRNNTATTHTDAKPRRQK